MALHVMSWLRLPVTPLTREEAFFILLLLRKKGHYFGYLSSLIVNVLWYKRICFTQFKAHVKLFNNYFNEPLIFPVVLFFVVWNNINVFRRTSVWVQCYLAQGCNRGHIQIYSPMFCQDSRRVMGLIDVWPGVSPLFGSGRHMS